jgi:type I restriction enzyme S subunit
MTSKWEYSTLGDILTLQRGMDLPVQERKGGKHPIVASNGVVGFHDEAPVKAPGVVIGRSGSIGGGQFIEQDFWPLNTTLWVKDFKGNDSRFCYYLLKSIDFSSMNAGSGVPTLNRNHLHPMRVAKPPVSVQKSISGILGSLDDRITLLRETNVTLEAIAQAMFKSWFMDFDPVRAKSEGKLPEGIDEATAALFPDSFEQSKLGEIPKGWKISNIGSELTTILGGTPSRERPEFWNDGVVSWINSGKVNEFRITTASELITEEALLKSATKLLPARTTVIAITGATLGQVSIVEIEACTNQSVVGLIQNEKFSTEYIYFWINFNIKKLISSQTGGAQQHINKGNVEDLHFLVPDIKILNEFKSISHPLFLKVAENCFQINTLGNIRDTLLPRLISGQLVFPDLDEINNKIKVKA